MPQGANEGEDAARLQRAQAVRPKRMSAVLHDVAVQRKQAKLARKAKAKGPPPARTARLNLTAAATVGPVLTDMLRRRAGADGRRLRARSMTLYSPNSVLAGAKLRQHGPLRGYEWV